MTAQALTRQLFRHNALLQVRWTAAGAVRVYLQFDKFGRILQYVLRQRRPDLGTGCPVSQNVRAAHRSLRDG